MSFLQIIALLVVIGIILPIVAYMVVKFGVTGYYRAKQRQEQKQSLKRNETKL